MAKKKKLEQIDTFLSPESSNVEGGTWDGDTKAATISFRNKKDPNATSLFYYYLDVARADWDALKNAPSKGKHMREVFRKKYKGIVLGTV
jgi:hypothetical protein